MIISVIVHKPNKILAMPFVVKNAKSIFSNPKRITNEC